MRKRETVLPVKTSSFRQKSVLLDEAKHTRPAQNDSLQDFECYGFWVAAAWVSLDSLANRVGAKQQHLPAQRGLPADLVDILSVPVL